MKNVPFKKFSLLMPPQIKNHTAKRISDESGKIRPFFTNPSSKSRDMNLASIRCKQTGRTAVKLPDRSKS